VFYNALGHNPEEFWNPALLRHQLDGIQLTLGDLEAPTEVP
jgi:type 1 glutamine amidotransferase